jgi:histidine ammonia-lyase
MPRGPTTLSGWLFGGLVWLGLTVGGAQAASPPPYRPIIPTLANETVTLTGHDMTIEQVVKIARSGAKVQLSPAARQRSADAYGLLLEAAAEGVQIYRFNRGAGSNREVVMFTGDPMSPTNKPAIEARELADFKRGVKAGYGPEIDNEETVRAMMAVRANTLTYASASPQLTQMLLDLLNDRITPVVLSGGTVGEGDLAQITNVEGAMVGVGEVYYRGERMPAAKALSLAGLKPLQPFGADDDAFDVTNAYAAAEAALLVDEGRQALEWADLIYAIDLDGMNSSITPMSAPVQADRPFQWLNWEAARVLDMVRGGYLFQDDPKRIIQDPESMRASPHRQAAAWLAWAELRAAVQTQINASEQNPNVRLSSPQDSWELSTPQFMRYHVKGGPYSNGRSGYVLSNANWDPYPLSNTVEAFTNALANMDVNVDQRLYRFTSTFFTVVSASDVLSADVRAKAPQANGGFIPSGIWQEILALTPPITPQGDAIVQNVEDLQANTNLKARRALQVVDLTFHLLAQDLLSGSYWIEVRKAQDPARAFGPGPTAALAALRRVVPWQADPADRPQEPLGQTTYRFLKEHPVAQIYPAALAVPAGDQPDTPWLKAVR